MGLPAIVTNTSGAQEIVDDGATGIVCDPEIEALEKAITRLLDAQLRDKMSHEARRRIKEVFTWDVAASKFVTILNNLNP
jgi:glycosyltransferase involved in cell wall biosynthesis